ncbi:type 4a pilus biogenesis protein PilO [Actinoplanes sp. NPDC051513]|uniref:type 4a pilus biogenesis protein PilO n=1 Tax=Actinoplanes sp. NPDC051513 TaxID=3363908 RepID=UPI0037AA860E
MGIRRTDRLWMLGGLFAIIVIVVAAYLLAIKPIYTDRGDKQSQAEDQELTLVTLRRQLNDLNAKSKNIATYTAQLNAKKGAMPDSYDMPNYLRALQISGTAVDVEVSGVSVGGPAKVTGSQDVISVPITLTATGTPADLSRFLNRLQNVQSRAVLITAINLGAGADPTEMSATLTISAFCLDSPKCDVDG